MKLSLWQQFSSNHSGHFFVVGVFPTSQQAQQAYDEIYTMLLSIDQWHQENPSLAKQAFDAGSLDLLPPEKVFAEKYNLEWETTIDWTNWGHYWMFADHKGKHQIVAGLINQAVRIVHQMIVITNPDQTWMTMQPFKGLLEKLGAKTVGFDFDHLENWEKVFFRITCTAPDDIIAQKLQQIADIPDLKLFTIERNDLTLTYQFQITTEEVVRMLLTRLKSSGCTNIEIDCFEKSE